MNETRTQGVCTISSQTRTKSSRTFRSGPYLHGLLTSAERVDAFLQREICARIKLARTEAGFTQQEMADLLNMSMRGYQNYESDRVPWRELDKIAELTGKPQEWFLRGDEEPATQSQTAIVELRAEIRDLRESVESLLLEVREARQAPPRHGRASGS